MRGIILFALVSVFSTTAHAYRIVVNYNQNYFKTITGTGYSCDRAKGDMYASFARWQEELKASGRQLVGAPSMDFDTCGQCAITEDETRNYVCLAKVTVQESAVYEGPDLGSVEDDEDDNDDDTAPAADKPKEEEVVRPILVSGKPHGAAINISPTFTSVGQGLDCFEAGHNARVSLFTDIESQSTSYEFGDRLNFYCACKQNGFPVTATCRSTVKALYLDSRASQN